jgi:hypothetical protein
LRLQVILLKKIGVFFSVFVLLLSYHFAGTLAIASSAKKPAVARAAAAAAVPATKSSGGFMFFGIRNNLWKAVRLKHLSVIHYQSCTHSLQRALFIIRPLVSLGSLFFVAIRPLPRMTLGTSARRLANACRSI